jgi:3-deoxy-manno-octulosonate cytidylyltransferase (CMP-KDO synthetase)
MEIILVIPARYQSVRFPGKPLARIKGIEMLKRVAMIANAISMRNKDCSYIVATDDIRILNFCNDNSLPVTMTSVSCKNGTERCFEVASNLSSAHSLIINLQGDNPLCPPHIIQALINSWRDSTADVYTPCVHLNWNEYEQLIASKQNTPFSGTTVIFDKQNYALSFSKLVIPAIRNIEEAKKSLEMSPVWRHIGLYAYTFSSLQAFISMPSSIYEQSYVEGLEQMRFLENGYKIKMVSVDYRGRLSTSGVDSPEDISHVESILDEFGELDLDNY